MGGLLFFFLIGLYLWVATKVVRRARPWWGKVLLVLVFILIPTADAFYGRIRLKQMCAAEGGLKIYKVVKGVDGFYDPSNRARDWLTSLTRAQFHYKFIEGGRDWDLVRATRDPAGNIAEQRLAGPASLDSQYVVDRSVDRKTGFIFQKYLVKDRHTQEVLGTSTTIAFYGGWAERFLGSIADSGPTSVGRCEVTAVGVDETTLLITSVLIPTQ